jgi:protein-S-isoprenylcysteine O-methyltransferase Ste14
VLRFSAEYSDVLRRYAFDSPYSAAVAPGSRVTSLARKTVLGFAQLIVAMAIALFGPAWTLDYWQAWVYLLVFVGSATIITLYLWRNDPGLLERRIDAGPAAEKQTLQKLIQAVAAITFIGFLVVPSLDHRFAWSRVPVALEVAGDVLMAIGFFIVFRVFRENSFTAATIEVSTDQKVISTGPYGIARHPMYAGALVMLFGTPLALGSWWGLLLLIPMTLVLVLRLLDEEKFLAKNLPGYTEYCQKVRYRLVPYIW